MPFNRTTESSTNLVDRWNSQDSGISDSVSDQSHGDQNGGHRVHFGPGISEEDEEDRTSETSVTVDEDEVENPGRCKSVLKRLFPPRGPVAKWITWGLLCLLLFGMTWSLAPEHMMPGQNIFGLFVTILLCFIAETLIVKIPMCDGVPPLPNLLASLLMGLMLANLPEPVNVAYYIDPEWSVALRTFSLSVILTNAGLELDPKAMEKVKWAVVRLAFLPCLGESLMVGIFGHLIMGFPWVWSLMLGFLVAAVSPAVVIPSLIRLQERGFGVAKGVPSLVMAASGIDDVLAIAGFTVFLGIAMPSSLEDDIINGKPPTGNAENNTNLDFSNDTSTIDYSQAFTTGAGSGHAPSDSKVGLELLGALVEVVIGVVAGLICGFLLSYIPHKDMRYKNFSRGCLLLSIGVLAVFGSEHWGIPGAGALWALTTSFVAAFHWKDECKPLEHAWRYMWKIFQPIMFGLTGATVRVEMLDGETVGLGLAVLLLGLIGRLTVSTSVTFGLNFNKKERAFVSIAWIPKGTVQAALGSAALDTALALNRPEQEVRWGEQILILAVLVTLITAPCGAFGISMSGPRLLESTTTREGVDNSAYETEESDCNGGLSAEELKRRRTSALDVIAKAHSIPETEDGSPCPEDDAVRVTSI